jgi:hypothetical protein
MYIAHKKSENIFWVYKILILIPIAVFLLGGNLPRLIWLLNDMSLLLMFILAIKKKLIFREINLYFTIFLLLTITTIGYIYNGLNIIGVIRFYDIFKGLIYIVFLNFLVQNDRNALIGFFNRELFLYFQ